jgi:pimeloyl-ACP methyl ester carboxylesterase
MVEHGSGPALVVIPGLPGPWKFIAPAVRALSAGFRVLTMSLGPECTIESDVARIAASLDERRIDRAVICGISLGGLVALRFAATHPERTSALVLVSAPGPGMRLRPHHRLYTRWPHLFGPLFVIETPFRLWRELHWSQITAALTTPLSFAKMAKRARLIESTDIAADCGRVVAPTLVVTGDARLDHVVPVESTMEYLRAIPGSQHATLAGTGHLGSVTRSHVFAGLVTDFVGRPFQGRHGRGPERAALRTDVARA